MNKDISTEEDIQLLVNSFYDQVKKDDIIGHIFNTTIGDDWSKHLPIMYQFWGTVLLNKEGYKGNVIKKHIDLDKQTSLQKEHYARWLQLWEETIDRLFIGEVADLAKNKASLMLNLISMKVDWARLGKNIQ